MGKSMLILRPHPSPSAANGSAALCPRPAANSPRKSSINSPRTAPPEKTAPSSALANQNRRIKSLRRRSPPLPPNNTQPLHARHPESPTPLVGVRIPVSLPSPTIVIPSEAAFGLTRDPSSHFAIGLGGEKQREIPHPDKVGVRNDNRRNRRNDKRRKKTEAKRRRDSSSRQGPGSE